MIGASSTEKTKEIVTYDTNKSYYLECDTFSSEISKKDYNLAYKVGNKLKNEIENGTNKYMNIDVLPYINKYFK